MFGMTNFLKETKEAILLSHHSVDDVMFVGSWDGTYRMTWEQFKKKANFEYDSGYGSQAIASDLIVYFKDKSYLSRKEYDGNEWWAYNFILDYEEDDFHHSFDILGGDNYMWETVDEMNNKQD